MDGTLLVEQDRRGAPIEAASLGMRCDSKEIPEALSGAKPRGWWLIDDCRFFGSAATPAQGERTETMTVQGTAALAVVEARVIGIVSRPSAYPALWWSWPLAGLKVEGVGKQGLIRKRPAKITLERGGGVEGDGDSLVFTSVSRLYRNSGRYQTGQEASLLQALAG